MREEYRMPPRVKLALCLIAALLAALATSGCGSNESGGGVSHVDPNAVTPAGVPVYVTPAVESDPAFKDALLEEIDTYGVPSPYEVVLHDEEYWTNHWGDSCYGYTDLRRHEIHAGRFADAPYLRVLTHEVQHALCSCACPPDGSHDADRRCR